MSVGTLALIPTSLGVHTFRFSSVVRSKSESIPFKFLIKPELDIKKLGRITHKFYNLDDL
ncbi:hypothetical protein LEP1GSC024_0824 [Leptospira noguchii str. 2001034031]|uniref:Uncharacterized protein n=1 Tax=Leptospira noguchii str. 2001034031 TaxID=1193053 RepID=M6YG56_9LEPT|nr:hypothetical protein LEP1GSC024_0824 [Leptospira noguchii str. 2001034031]